ncbi:MAG: hypothetical protein IT464_12210 [Planctomycetes bacterium]|nr:hypothetical protein [Planctomycetota bacterium]
MTNLGKNTLGMLAIAALTMVASLAVLAPQFADATDGEEAKTSETLRKVTPEIAVPSLKEDGCTITIKTDKESYAAGEKPILTIEVKNNTDKSIDKSINVSMSGRDLESRSRMPAMARVLWKDSRTVTLAAGESKTLTIETDTKVSDRQAISIYLGGNDEVGIDEVVEKALRTRN